MKIAIIGSGISGLVCAHHLYQTHEITIFEAEDYVGGHTHTIDIEEDGICFGVDTGFIVFNDWTYPEFIRLLNEIDAASQPSSMGFSVCCERNGLEYSGSSLAGLFAQPRNLVNIKHHRMILDILRFFREGKAFLDAPDESLSFEDYLDDKKYSNEFSERFLVPMLSAIWSAAPQTVRQFPAAHFLRFFKNHGLLNVLNRPVWRVIQGGSSRYVDKLIQPFADKIRLNTPVQSITRDNAGVTIKLSGDQHEQFDSVIIATHSDQALRILDTPTQAEQEILGSIAYQPNETVLHTDTSLLPKSRRAWAAWNYRIRRDDIERATLTYNMNILQGLQTRQTYCVTLNNTKAIDPEKIIDHFLYYHPVYSEKVLEAQSRWNEISGQQHTHYCGAYWGYGFHEDGVRSGLAVCKQFSQGYDS